jgi:hypothetical protein
MSTGLGVSRTQNKLTNLSDREKRLDLSRWGGKRIRHDKRTSPVTIVSAIIGREGIVMASDSRTTFEDGRIRDDTKKVFTVRLADGFGFLLGHSGHDDLGSRTVETILQLAQQTKIKDYRTCAELVESAFTQLKNDIRAQFMGTAEELQRHLQNHSFDIIIAHYYRDETKDGRLRAPQPYIFTGTFSVGVMRRQMDKSFVTIGCGSTIADLVLGGFSVSDFDYSQTVAMSVYTVGQAKRFDQRCGGKTQVAVAEKVFFIEKNIYHTPVFELDDNYILDFVRVTDEIEKEIRDAQHKMMRGALEKIQKFTKPRIDAAIAESGGVRFEFDGKISPYSPPEKI